MHMIIIITMEFLYINTVRIFFILILKKYLII